MSAEALLRNRGLIAEMVADMAYISAALTEISTALGRQDSHYATLDRQIGITRNLDRMYTFYAGINLNAP
jgi:hypothetical protein